MPELFDPLIGNPNSSQGALAGSLTLPPLRASASLRLTEDPALAGHLGPRVRTHRTEDAAARARRRRVRTRKEGTMKRRSTGAPAPPTPREVLELVAKARAAEAAARRSVVATPRRRSVDRRGDRPVGQRDRENARRTRTRGIAQARGALAGRESMMLTEQPSVRRQPDPAPAAASETAAAIRPGPVAPGRLRPA